MMPLVCPHTQQNFTLGRTKNIVQFTSCSGRMHHSFIRSNTEHAVNQ